MDFHGGLGFWLAAGKPNHDIDMMKIVLANCTVSNGNRGCVALSVSTMYILKQILEDRHIEYEFILSNSGYEDAGKESISMGGFVFDFTKVLSITDPSILERTKRMVLSKRYRPGYKTFKSADFILDIGQGDSFSDIYGKRRFDLINGSHVLGRKYHRPYCLLPQTIGPYENEHIAKKARKSINYASCVMVRDKQSYDYVKQLLPNKEVSEAIDVAFYMPYKRKIFDKQFIHVGLNISALLWHGGYLRNNQFGLNVDYQKLVHDIIDYFLSMDNVKLHLIPHVVGGERHIENDYAVSYDLCEEYDNEKLILPNLFLDPIAAKNYIAGMDFFMGARMHATIAAFSTGVPVVPMAYSRKFNGLFVDTLRYGDLIDMKTASNEEALSMIKECFARREEEKAIIQNRMDTVVQERKRVLFDNLTKFLNL